VRTVIRIALTVAMDAMLLLAALLLGRVVIEFFGQLAGVPGASLVIRLSDLVVLPLGLTEIPTPYHGVFDVNASVTLVAALGVEWVAAVARRRFAR